MFFLLGALLYRIRGGFDPFPINGTQTARMFWCLPIGLLAGLFTLEPLVGLMVAVLALLGLLTPFHMHGYMMIWPVATDHKGLRLATCLFLGVARLAMLLAPVAFVSHWWIMALSAFGLLHALAYWLGWKVLPVAEEDRNNNSVPVDAETAWAELIWGGIQYEVMVLALLLAILI